MTWLTSAEAAEYAGVSRHTLLDWLESGRLVGFKTNPGSVRSQWRCRRQDIDALFLAGRVAS